MTDDPYAIWDAQKTTQNPRQDPAQPSEPRFGNKGALTALAREVEAVATAANGTRNHQLNRSTFNLAQLVAGGELDEADVRSHLTAAAQTVGLDDDEISATINSGFRAGQQTPRTVGALPPAPIITVLDAPTETPGDTAAALSTRIRERLPIINWHDLWADESTEDWIVEPILPARRLVALYSPPKVGKSLLLLEIAVGVSTATTVLGVTPDRPRRVLYVDFENDPRGDTRARLQAMGRTPHELDNLCYLAFPTLSGLDSEAGSLELMAAIHEYQCEVVVIDTVSRSIRGIENENDTWIAFYNHTGLKLKQAGITLMRLDHSGKDETKGQRGGSAKSGDVDVVWRMSKVTDDTFRLDCEANRMPIAEKTIVLKRHTLPFLKHVVQAEGRKAAWDAKVDAVVAMLNSAGLPHDAGRDKAREVLKSMGQQINNELLTLSVRKRRGQVTILDLSGNVADRSRTGDTE